MKAMKMLGVEFINKICQSCLHSPNLFKINLFITFTNSLMNPDNEVCIKNLGLWFSHIKPIIFNWTECFKLMSQDVDDERYDEKAYNFLYDLLTNKNLNFYLAQRSN